MKVNVEFRCVKCQAELSSYQRIFANSHRSGECPSCGHRGSNGFLETTKHTYKIVRVGSWWEFWKKEYKREYL